MSYVRKNSTKVLGSVLGVIVLVALAVWQFYLFVTFKDESGVVAIQGGTHHLWWAIGMAVFACFTSFLIFSAFMQHDRDDELHITN